MGLGYGQKHVHQRICLKLDYWLWPRSGFSPPQGVLFSINGLWVFELHSVQMDGVRLETADTQHRLLLSCWFPAQN